MGVGVFSRSSGCVVSGCVVGRGRESITVPVE